MILKTKKAAYDSAATNADADLRERMNDIRSDIKSIARDAATLYRRAKDYEMTDKGKRDLALLAEMIKRLDQLKVM